VSGGVTTKSALAIVDMQNGFLRAASNDAAPTYVVVRAAEILQRTAAVIRQWRRLGAPIVFTRHGSRPEFADTPRFYADNANRDRPFMVTGSAEWELAAELGVHSTDLVVDKNRFDAFLFTDLELLLRRRGVEQLVVCGVTTNLCVETSVRSATQRDFVPTVVSDCTSALTLQEHLRSLASRQPYFARVIDSTALMDEVAVVGGEWPQATGEGEGGRAT